LPGSGGLGVLKIAIGGKAKLVVPVSVVLVFLFIAIFFFLSAIATYAGRLAAIPGFGGGCGTTTCQGAFETSKLSQYEAASGEDPGPNWAMSSEGKDYATSKLGVSESDIKQYSKANVKNMIRAEIAQQFSTLSDKHGSEVQQAQRAILSYQEHESSSFQLFTADGKPSYSSGVTLNIMSLTKDKFEGSACKKGDTVYCKNKRIAASYDIHYAIYLGVQEMMSTFSAQGGSKTGLERWKYVIGYVFLPSDPARYWSDSRSGVAKKAWDSYSTEIAYSCGSSGSAGGSVGGSVKVPEGASTEWHENIATTQFAGCGKDGKCADNKDSCGSASGLRTDCKAKTQMFAALPYSTAKLCKGKLENCAHIEVKSGSKSVVLAVVDVGPCNINDPDYVMGTAKPLTVLGTHGSCPSGSNHGLDISPTAIEALGGKGEITASWRFTTSPISGESNYWNDEDCYTTDDGTGGMPLQIARGEINNDDYKRYNGHYRAWCADFVSWVYKKAGYGVPIMGAPNAVRDYFKKHSDKFIWVDKPSSNQIRPGDVVLFWNNPGSNSGTHIGIVESVNGDTVHTIEGNTGRARFGTSRVTRQTRKLSDRSPYIQGVGRAK
jgi:hypothetical protein